MVSGEYDSPPKRELLQLEKSTRQSGNIEHHLQARRLIAEWHRINFERWEARNRLVPADVLRGKQTFHRQMGSIEIDYRYAFSCALLGQELGKHKQWEEAIASYRRALAVFPGKGDIDSLVGLNAEAERVFRKHLALIHSQLGDAILNRADDRHLDEAIRCFRAAIDARGDGGGPHTKLALALVRMGKEDEALLAFRRAAEHKSSVYKKNSGNEETRRDAVTAFKNLVKLLLGQDKKDEAMKVLRQATALGLKDAWFTDKLNTVSNPSRPKDDDKEEDESRKKDDRRACSATTLSPAAPPELCARSARPATAR